MLYDLFLLIFIFIKHFGLIYITFKLYQIMAEQINK